MRHASLFSGIGGPEVAAAMLGWDNVFHCEINEFGRKVLDFWFPESESYEDITKTDFRKFRGTIDVLTGGFPCQPFSYAGRRGGNQTSAISGRKCSELLTKSGRLGSLVKMLLESQQWWSPVKLLTWEVKPICFKRVVEFTDTQLSSPSPSNESAQTLNQRDIQSSRCLFRLALSERLIEEIESFSSHTTTLLQTPSTREVCESPQQMQQRKERNGYRNGTKYNGLMSQLMHDPKVSHLLPTPRANKVTDMDLMSPKLASRNKGNLEEAVAKMILPTPNARDWKGRTNPGVVKEGSGCKYGETLPDAIARMTLNLIPTPTATDYLNPYAPDKMVTKDGVDRNSLLRSLPTQLGVYIPASVGVPSRMSPLFTEEMMGFPLMWTALPFLSQNGELKQ